VKRLSLRELFVGNLEGGGGGGVGPVLGKSGGGLKEGSGEGKPPL
jgi:hypothetical protein